MSTFREILYMIQDECKFIADDSYYTHGHIVFLMKRYRSLLFQQKYGKGNIKQQIPPSARQEICIELIEVPGNRLAPCDSGTYLRSTRPIPDIMPYTKPQLYTDDIYSTIGQLDLVNYDRMRYTGENRYLKKIIYASIAPDKHLYMKSQNPAFANLGKVRMSAVFEDIEDAARMSCDGECDILDTPFPIEDALVPMLIATVVKELTDRLAVPEDKSNNADDNQNENMYANGNARPAEE